METPWDESHDTEAAWKGTRDAEWTKMSSEFTDVGYREGITAGKEAFVQEGFDTGFATVGAPLGRNLGVIRGQSSALLSFLTSAPSASLSLSEDAKEAVVQEARDIVSQLGKVRFSDIEPRDLEAEKHAKEHLEAEGQEMELHEKIERKRQMENVEDMLAGLSAGGTLNASERPTMEDVANLEARLHALTLRLGIRNLH
ncbi:hypothetical protein J132_02473 [Termitomyces sp. J132]|nr:hypothetical protein C0989_010859 [Termitomyces sp. Mn162]KAH0579700.1 hypothetical protein H2248_002543 [Termitomyces sp. 'cryptogamus']KNZ75533.1 hypothetical protein J132_02473 [Termitomyces sp. J132]